MIFVTGGTGLLGAHLLYHLVSGGEKVRAFKRASSDITITREIFNYYSAGGDRLFQQVKWVEGDLHFYPSVREMIEEAEIVYHCAAFVSFDPARKSRMIKDNIEVTANIVNSMLDKGKGKLCFVSSTAALGASVNGEMVDENCLWKPARDTSAYSKSKYKSEMEVWRGIMEGLDAVIVNPSVIIGPGNWGKSSSALFTSIWKGMRFYTEGVTGYVDVNDVAECMITLTNSDISGERYIISAENKTYREIFTLIAKELGRKPPSIKATPIMASLAWRTEWLRGKLFFTVPAITRETALAGFNKVHFSNQKIRETTGISFKPIKESIRETARLFPGKNEN
ncbi:MAG: NAD-dependent epimerase/dehydratase family protein [Bacteroidota bacterium]